MAAAAAQNPTDGVMKIKSSEKRLSVALKRLDSGSMMSDSASYAPVWHDNGSKHVRDTRRRARLAGL